MLAELVFISQDVAHLCYKALSETLLPENINNHQILKYIVVKTISILSKIEQLI